ncbi:MAG: Bax inhibitor-1/YccA family protein [Fuerstiella sp.]
MQSSNPALSENVFRNFESYGDHTVMTLSGTATKTIIAIGITMAAAAFAWAQLSNGGPVIGYLAGGGIVGFIIAIATMFKPSWAPITTPLYAIAEGCFLGAVSLLTQNMLLARNVLQPGQNIAIQACAVTFGVLAVMMILYQTGTIRVTNKLRFGIVAAGGAIFLVYLINIIMSFFGAGIGFIHNSGPLGIAFSVLAAGVAAFFLLLDFDQIDRLAASRAPKYMEWYGAFTLLMTLVWLYLEILRLLSKLQSRD